MVRIVLYGQAQIYGAKARTLDMYVLLQRNILKENNMGEPWVYLGPLLKMYISGGKCVVDCPNCMDAPAVDVEARIALCCGCGAIFNNVIVPSPQEYRDLEEVMSVRPVPARNSRHHEEKRREATVKELDEENQARGLPPLDKIREMRRAR